MFGGLNNRTISNCQTIEQSPLREKNNEMKTKSNNDIVLIEDYLDGKLSKTEIEQFLQRLESDKEFSNLYRFRLKIKGDWQKARQYESVQQEVAGAIRNEKSKKRRTVIYARCSIAGIPGGNFRCFFAVKPGAGTFADNCNR
jgi:hypothetical protein